MRLRLVAISLIMAAMASFIAAAQTSEEASLIAALSSNAPIMDKVDACHRLKEIGTIDCVPALAALLPDNDLSHPARQALESLPLPEAADALIAALDSTSGMNRAGIIDSLGLRHETKAVQALSGLVKDADPATAIAAATSLGRIGTEETVEPLASTLDAPEPAVRAAGIDGMLRCIARLQADGHNDVAQKVAADLCRRDLPQQFRIGAQKAAIDTAPDRLAAAMDAITGFNGPARLAGLRVINEITGADAAQAIAAAISKVDASTQVALLHALAQRRDSSVLPQVIEAASSAESAVRVAALNALGAIGNRESVALLVERAATADETEREAARQALTLVSDPDAGTAMVELLANAPAAEQIELIKAMAVRRDKRCVPTLVELAKGSDNAVVSASLRTMSSIADASSAPRIIDLLCTTQADKVRDAAEDALVKIAGRSDAGAVIGNLKSLQGQQAPAVRLALLSVMARIDFNAAKDALRAAMADATPEVHTGAVRLFTENCTPDAIQDVLALANNSNDDIERTLILRDYWRLFDLLKTKPAEERFQMVQAGMQAARTAESRKSAVGALADIPLKSALEAAQQACADDVTKPEAQLALYKIAGSFLLSDRPAAEVAMKSLSESAVDEGIRSKAANVLASLKQNSDYIVPWLVSGPYWTADKEAQALFDIPLGPELPDGGNATWQLAPANPDPLMWWLVDLNSTVNGIHRLLYLKTQVYSPVAREAVLEIGSDDGIKLWVNDQLVHANNAVRGFSPGADQAKVNLKQGWNTFFAKITQSTAGCSMGIKIVPAYGAAAEPLKVEAK